MSQQIETECSLRETKYASLSTSFTAGKNGFLEGRVVDFTYNDKIKIADLLTSAIKNYGMSKNRNLNITYDNENGLIYFDEKEKTLKREPKLKERVCIKSNDELISGEVRFAQAHGEGGCSNGFATVRIYFNPTVKMEMNEYLEWVKLFNHAGELHRLVNPILQKYMNRKERRKLIELDLVGDA